jgi:hypothetical protein
MQQTSSLLRERFRGAPNHLDWRRYRSGCDSGLCRDRCGCGLLDDWGRGCNLCGHKPYMVKQTFLQSPVIRSNKIFG